MTQPVQRVYFLHGLYGKNLEALTSSALSLWGSGLTGGLGPTSGKLSYIEKVGFRVQVILYFKPIMELVVSIIIRIDANGKKRCSSFGNTVHKTVSLIKDHSYK